MAAKVFRSTLTWRTLEYQDSVFAGVVLNWPNVPVYTGEAELDALVRPTLRKTTDTLYMASLAVLAVDKKNLRERMRGLLKKKMLVVAIEDKAEWKSSSKIADMVTSWATARRVDSGKRGGRISADRKLAETKEAIDLIRDRWPMSSKEWPTNALLKEADISLNTAKAHLGKRPIAQYNYQAKLKRKENAKKYTKAGK